MPARARTQARVFGCWADARAQPSSAASRRLGGGSPSGMAQTSSAQPTILEEEEDESSTVAEDEEEERASLDRQRQRPGGSSGGGGGGSSSSSSSAGDSGSSGSSQDDYDKLSEDEEEEEEDEDDDMESETNEDSPRDGLASRTDCCVITVATECGDSGICPAEAVPLAPCGSPRTWPVPCASSCTSAPPSPPTCPRPLPSYTVEWPSPDGKPASVTFQELPIERPASPSDAEDDDEDDSSDKSRNGAWMREDEKCCTCAMAVRVIVCLLTISCCSSGLILTILGVLEKHRQCTATGCILLLTGAGLCMHLCLRNTAPPRRVDMLHVIRETTLRKRLAAAAAADERRDSLHSGSRDSAEREICRPVVIPAARKRSGSIWKLARRMSMTADASAMARRSISNSGFGGHGNHLHHHRLTSFGHVDHYDHYHYSYM